MVGFAESLDDVFNNHKLFVAPLLSGAGIKGKVLEAMAYGTPSVVTDVAAEGTGLVNNVNAVITNNASDFAAAIVDLYSDNNKLKKQLQYANNNKIPFVVIVGEEEIKSKKYTLKNMETGKQEKLTLNKILDRVSK